MDGNVRAPLNPVQVVSRRAGKSARLDPTAMGLVLPRHPWLPRRRPALVAAPIAAALITPRLPRRRPALVAAALVTGPPVVAVVVAVEIAVVVVVAGAPVEVEAPLRVPVVAGAPVIRRKWTGLGLGGTRRQPQTGQPQTAGHQCCRR
jgi:hypothetical protein